MGGMRGWGFWGVFVATFFAAAGCISDGFEHTVVLSGTACGLGIEYASPGNQRIRVYQDAQGMLRGVVVGNCEPFDLDDRGQWNSCAVAHDLHVALWFEDSAPDDVEPVLTLLEGTIAARRFGTLTTVDHGDGERVAVDTLDPEHGEVALRLNLPVASHDANFPPSAGGSANCADDVLVGVIVGAYEAVAYP